MSFNHSRPSVQCMCASNAAAGDSDAAKMPFHLSSGEMHHPVVVIEHRVGEGMMQRVRWQNSPNPTRREARQ